VASGFQRLTKFHFVENKILLPFCNCNDWKGGRWWGNVNGDEGVIAEAKSIGLLTGFISQRLRGVILSVTFNLFACIEAQFQFPSPFVYKYVFVCVCVCV